MRGHPSTHADLSLLILRASGGDKAALGSLLALYRPYLRVMAEKTLRPLFRARFDGSDIVQETCHDALCGIATLRGTSEAEFNAWINRILHNNVVNLIRNHTADRRNVLREQVAEIRGSDISIQWGGGAAGGRRPESQIIQGEAALLLAQSLQGLPGDQRTAVQMRYLEACTLADIAEYLQMSPSSVVRLIDRGLQALHNALPDGVI